MLDIEEYVLKLDYLIPFLTIDIINQHQLNITCLFRFGQI